MITTDPGLLDAEDHRHGAVRTAVEFLVQGCPTFAFLTLVRSMQDCAALDHRPLDPGRVQARADALLGQLHR